MVERLTSRSVYFFIFLFLLSWISAWLLHVLITGSIVNTLVLHNVLWDTAYWLSMKLIIWIWFPFIYFRHSIPNLLKFIGVDRSSLISGIKYGTAAALIWTLVSIFFALLSGQTLSFHIINWQIFIYSVIVTPAIEEILYRGVILSSLTKTLKLFWKANVITSLAFILPHIIGWGFQGVLPIRTEFPSLVTLFIFSLIVGYVRNKSKSITGGFLIHMFNNLLAFFVL
ncbi:MAG: type II CAAX endopeptidase family protein [Patescibacteria group bacterium]